MTFKKMLVVLYTIIISIIALSITSLSYNKFSRNKTINYENTIILEKYLSESEIIYLIDENIDVNRFINLVQEDDFKLVNYQFYEIITKKDATMAKDLVVQYGNEIVTLEFTLKSFTEIIELGNYNVAQLITLSTEDSQYYTEAKPNFFPKRLLALSNEFFNIYNYQPDDLVVIDQKLTNNIEIALRNEANIQLTLLCENLTLITNVECGGLIVEQGYLSYQVVEDNLESYPLFKPGHNDFQIGNTIALNSDITTLPIYYWLLDNAHKYGFVQRYPNNKSNITNVTGLENVFRYVGRENAKELYDKKLVIEEKK